MGANVNAASTTFKETALHTAVGGAFPAAASLLVEHGSDVNAANAYRVFLSL